MPLYRYMMIMIIAMRWELPDMIVFYEKEFKHDLVYCYNCFEHQIEACNHFHATLANMSSGDAVDVVTGALEMILRIVGGYKRLIGLIITKAEYGSEPLFVVKRYGLFRPEAKLFNQSKKASQSIMEYYIAEPHIHGFEMCPKTKATMQRFIAVMLQEKRAIYAPNELNIMLHLVDNVQPLLAAVLYARGWPVSRTVAHCGFTHYEAYGGKTLTQLYHLDAGPKLDIARQLLRAALLFSDGIEDFRVYITDLSTDNVVYDEKKRLLTIVDLDTVLLVDANGLVSDGKPKNMTIDTHCHEYIKCDNCFAFSPEELCAHNLSDINVFVACQMMREDLRRNQNRGFLSSLPLSAYPQLSNQFNMCMECKPPRCKHRFPIARRLIQTLDRLLVTRFNYTN